MFLREYVFYVMQPCLFIDVRPPSLHIILLLLVLCLLSLVHFLPSFLPPSIGSSLTARDRRCCLRDHRRLTQTFADTRGLGFSRCRDRPFLYSWL